MVQLCALVQNIVMSVMINTRTGLIRQARQVASTNYDARPAGKLPDMIVVHAISLPPGEYGGPWIDQFFSNCLDCSQHPFYSEIETMRVSAHVLIRRDGELVQYVPLGMRAWHAGESCFGDRKACNDFSIGIELEGDDDTPFTDAQYEQLTIVCGALRRLYPEISDERIVGHSDIAPGRKTDPGPCFDWKRFKTDYRTLPDSE